MTDLAADTLEAPALPRARADLLTHVERLFSDGRERVSLPLAALARAGHAPRDLGAARVVGDAAVIGRAGFYQTPAPWLRHPQVQRVATGTVPGPDGRDHPPRPADPVGEVYARRDPVAGLTVSFRTVDIDRDLDMFHRWQNDPRVAYFWEEDRSREELRQFLETRRDDPHNVSLIGCFNGEPAGYFEAYWAREDRLGAHYDAGPWDRGWHGLIGEARHLGRAKTAAWLRGLTHYLFLDCPMTEQIVGEPRVDNAKLLRYADALAYEKVKEFDFPHKRSALMRCRRTAFFDQVRL